MTDAVRGMRAAVNASRETRVGNSLACRVYADAVEEAGRGDEARVWRLAADFLDAWHDMDRSGWHYEHVDPDDGYAKLAIDRKRYIALDCGTSGAFLLDKASGTVYQIRGYGKRGRAVSGVEYLTRQYREATAANLAVVRAEVAAGTAKPWMARVAAWFEGR